MIVLFPLLCALAVPPRIAVTLRDPSVNLPKLRPLLEWVGRAEPSLAPDRLERWAGSRLGQAKLFDPATLKALGLDPKAPIRVLLPETRGPLILELSVAEPSRVDALIGALPGAKPVASTKAVILQRAGARPLLVTRIDRRLIVQEVVDPTRAAVELREGEATDRAKPKGRAPLVIQIRDLEPIEQAQIDVDLAPNAIEAKARARLSLAARMIAGDLLGGRPARRYLRALEGIAELSGTAGPGALREALIEAGMPAAEADDARKLLSGEHAVSLTQDGILAGVVRLSGSASTKAVAALSERLQRLQPGLQVQRAGSFLLGWFPGADPARGVALSAEQLEAAPRAEGPLQLQLSPGSLLPALRRRARTRSGPVVPIVPLILFETLYEGLLRNTSSVRLVATEGRGEARLTVNVEYR